MNTLNLSTFRVVELSNEALNNVEGGWEMLGKNQLGDSNWFTINIFWVPILLVTHFNVSFVKNRAPIMMINCAMGAFGLILIKLCVILNILLSLCCFWLVLI